MWVMANKAITKGARRAAREAAAAAQEELARRTRANVEDLATFFSARERADAIDEWLAERQQLLREQAAQRRAEQRVQCGRALRAMRDRGETLREIARMGGVAEKTVREMIKEADAIADAPGVDAVLGEVGGHRSDLHSTCAAGLRRIRQRAGFASRQHEVDPGIGE